MFSYFLPLNWTVLSLLYCKREEIMNWEKNNSKLYPTDRPNSHSSTKLNLWHFIFISFSLHNINLDFNCWLLFLSTEKKLKGEKENGKYFLSSSRLSESESSPIVQIYNKENHRWGMKKKCKTCLLHFFQVIVVHLIWNLMSRTKLGWNDETTMTTGRQVIFLQKVIDQL